MAKIPIPKLPKLSLPSFRRGKTADPVAAGSEEDAARVESGLVPPEPAAPRTPILRRVRDALLGRVGQALVLLVFLGGIGAVGYWAQMHAEETVARRELTTPRERISLIPEEERAARIVAAKEAAEAAQQAGAEASDNAGETAEAEADPTDAAGAETADGNGEAGDAPADEETAAEAADETGEAAEAAAGDGDPAADSDQTVASLPQEGEAADQSETSPESAAGPVRIPELIEKGPQGPLPVPSAEGLQPWKAYSRPFNDNDPRPRIAIIITNLGLSSSATQAAIQDLPGEITLAFQPFANRLEEWIPLARAAGHEVLLAVPMEPTNFPASDPGPMTLLTSLPQADNLDRLDWALSRFTGYVGVINHLGGRFATSEESLVPILTAIRNRGLLFVDTKPTSNSLATQVAETLQMVHAFNDRFIDDEPNRWSIDARLQELERIARRTGFAVGVGQAYPVTLERLRSWATTLPTRGLAMAPITAVADKQEVLN